METTLFWIGCGLGVYAYALRRLFQKTLLERRSLMVFLHLLFMSVVGALLGFVISASTDLHGPSPRWSIIGAVIGFVVGVHQFMWDRKNKEAIGKLISIDLEWVETSFSALILASIIMYSVMQAFKIPSSSMEDTLLVGDHLFVNKFIYGVRIPFTDRRVFKLREVQRRDVVVFEAPMNAIVSPDERARNVRKDFIKRAIGLSGDTIEIRNKRLYVNGVLQDEPFVSIKDRRVYPAEPLGISPADYQRLWESGRFSELRRDQIGDNFGPLKVPEGYYFVMGDNRDNSFDSRFWGPLPNRLLKGKAWLVYWPPRRIKLIK